MYIYIYIHTYICVYIYIYTHTYICLFINLFVYIHMYSLGYDICPMYYAICSMYLSDLYVQRYLLLFLFHYGLRIHFRWSICTPG